MKKVRFSDVFDDITKKAVKIPTNEYLSNGLYQIIDQGQSDIAGYSNNQTGLYTDVPVIVFGDHTRILKYIDKPLFLGADGVKLLKVKDRNFNCKYLFYALCNARIPDTGYNRHFKWLKEVKIPIPSIDEQQKIASILDKVSDLIALRKQQLAKLDELVKSRFVEMFGDLINHQCQWEMCQLKEVCKSTDDIKCGPFGTQLGKEEYRKEGIAVWEIPQINSSFMSPPTDFVSEEKAKQLSAYSIIPGDIAMSRKGNVGKCAIFPEQYASGIIHSDVLRIRVNKQKVVSKFMMYQLRISKAVEAQIAIVSSGAIMAGINVTKLKNINVHIPPMELQKQFTCFIDKIDSLNSDIEKSLEELNILKKSLMQEYFA